MQTANEITYLDNNATTALDPVVLETMLPWLQSSGYGNPSSPYSIGKKARKAVETAREQVVSLLNASASEILFTSCGTESINAAILAACNYDPDRRHVITSAVEHSATLKLCEHLARRGYQITYLPVDSEGRLSAADVQKAITDETALVTLLWANNETGVLFPIEEIAAVCQAEKVPLHLDAVQAVGKIPIDVEALGVSMLSLSGHKLHAPKGIGALYVNKRFRFIPLLRGSQENERRGGTENVASIVALGKSSELAKVHFTDEQERVRALRDRFENAILKNIPDTRVNGSTEFRLPNTSNIHFDGVESEGVLMLLDDAGICCSAGSACTTGSVTPSHVLTAMGKTPTEARSSLRFSFGRLNTESHVDHAIATLPAVIEKLRTLNPAGQVVIQA
ncbi:MAG: cysteine desulfurase family protein [Chthoniobacterales bacterium]